MMATVDVSGCLINHTVASNILFYKSGTSTYEKATTDSQGNFTVALEAGTTYTPIKVRRYDPPSWVPCCGPDYVDVPSGVGTHNMGNVNGCGYYVKLEAPPEEEEADLPEQG